MPKRIPLESRRNLSMAMKLTEEDYQNIAAFAHTATQSISEYLRSRAVQSVPTLPPLTMPTAGDRMSHYCNTLRQTMNNVHSHICHFMIHSNLSSKKRISLEYHKEMLSKIYEWLTWLQNYCHMIINDIDLELPTHHIEYFNDGDAGDTCTPLPEIAQAEQRLL